MTKSEALLIVVAVLVIFQTARADMQYRRLARMFADLATMTGDAFDEMTGGNDG